MKKIFLVLFVEIFLTGCLLNFNNMEEPKEIIFKHEEVEIPNVEEILEDLEIIEPKPESLTYYYPIDGFKENILLKPFGLYSTPGNSPVDPEHFTGYHTGVDIEITEDQIDEDVWVYAVADGTIEVIRTASGYGGVMVMSTIIDDESYFALYGHIDIKSISVEVGDEVTAGQKLAVLGEGYSVETDGERKHLHFSLYTGDNINLLGYVQNESELDAWVDPEELLIDLID